MDIFMMLATLIVNAIAILLIYQFVKKLPRMDKLLFIAVSYAILYFGVIIIYWISGFGIDSQINDAAKDFVTYLFVPVNVILLIPFVANKFAKMRNNEISKRDFYERLIKVVFVGVIILVIECVYFKNMKQNIMYMKETAQSVKLEGQEQNTILENVVDETNKSTTNEIRLNLTNTEIVNETTNTVSRNVVEKTLNKNELE